MSDKIEDVIARAVVGAVQAEVVPALREAVRAEVLGASRRDPDRIVQIDEAAELLGCSPAALRKRVGRGQVAARKSGGPPEDGKPDRRRLRFRVGDLLALGAGAAATAAR